MSTQSRLLKLEGAAACDVTCAWHTLSDITLRVPADPGDVFAGTCCECGEDMEFNMAGCTPRERELSTELYARGWTLDTLTASRRSLAAMLWLYRRGQNITPSPGEVYKRALIEEHARRMEAKWAAHLETISDELLEMIVDLTERDPSDAELEEIIWPGSRDTYRSAC